MVSSTSEFKVQSVIVEKQRQQELEAALQGKDNMLTRYMLSSLLQFYAVQEGSRGIFGDHTGWVILLKAIKIISHKCALRPTSHVILDSVKYITNTNCHLSLHNIQVGNRISIKVC